MVRNFISVVALCALLAASTAFAQGRGGRGGRGQGGPGGMRASADTLLRMPEVQTELKITDEQKTKIQTARDDVRQANQNAGGQGGGFQRNMTQEERAKVVADMQARFEKIGKEMDEKLATILTADQLTRLKQLELQFEGVNALTSSDIVTKLKVTDDQKAKIEKVIADARSNRGQRGNFNPNATDAERQAATQARRDARAKTLKDAVAALDDDLQLVQWGEMRGKEFTFPENAGFGGRGGQGGRGGRGGGGGNGGGGNGGGGNGGGGNGGTGN